MAIASRPDHARRIEAAKAVGLSRKPIPILLVLVRVLRDGWEGDGPDGAFAFPSDVDRTEAMDRLRNDLDQGDGSDMGEAVAAWCRQNHVRWINRA